MLPKAALDELVKREAASGQYRTRIAASILERELLGEVHTYYPRSL